MIMSKMNQKKWNRVSFFKDQRVEDTFAEIIAKVVKEVEITLHS